MHISRKYFFSSMIFISVIFLLFACSEDEQPDLNHESLIPVMQTAEWADWWPGRHEQKLMEIQNNPEVDAVLLGDSILHNWENMGLDLWSPNPEGYTHINLGFAGDSTEHVLWRIENGELDGINPKVLILLIGTNNTGHRMDPAVQTAFAIGKIVFKIRQKLKNTKIILMNILPREELPDDPLRLINDDINMIVAMFDNNRDVFVLDMSHVFLEDTGHLRLDLIPGGLHPNYIGNLQWREAMAPLLEHVMSL